MPRPRSLTPTAVAAATVAVIDRDGLDALTMRTVAKELGMATMSLYRYVSDRAELEALVVDHVLAGIDLSPPTGADWRARVTVLIERMRDAVRAHSGMVPLMVRHRHSSPASLHWIEATLTVLTDAGFRGVDRAIAQRTVVGFLIGALQSEYYGPLSGTGTATMARLSAEEFPTLTETAADAREIPPDEEFRRGLDIVLRGLVPGGGEVL
ncbi:MAG: TetR family transcriptional regulator [Actinophytocola sp.]|uniref:TetR/AcrR family transcriptional regulator n=1 Tax=Actinophytocola sp. TaxID=1872138 RepID=UPI00132655F6|nr:TetR/AcrR family transcriptional regulator C-terminal domain-containing protein [Actinophytocola sp.]MPZ84236.1 TetR family transcriptional regulator [Actinophytocola sp.]